MPISQAKQRIITKIKTNKREWIRKFESWFFMLKGFKKERKKRTGQIYEQVFKLQHFLKNIFSFFFSPTFSAGSFFGSLFFRLVPGSGPLFLVPLFLVPVLSFASAWFPTLTTDDWRLTIIDDYWRLTTDDKKNRAIKPYFDDNLMTIIYQNKFHSLGK